jgi:hypothetical protein
MVKKERKVRLWSALDDRFGLLLGAVLVLVLAGSYLTITAYAQTHTDLRTEQTSSWESSASFDHSATIVTDTDVYTRGETLRNRSSYFREITPRLDGSFRYTYTATEGGDLTANASVVLILRSVTEGDTGNSTEYWRLESTLANRSVPKLSPGESVEIPFSTNVSAAALRLDAVDQQVGGTPGQEELLVEARFRLSGTRNGQRVDERKRYRLPVSLSNNVYTIRDPGTVTATGGQTEQVAVAVPPSPLRAYGGPALLVVGLVAAVGLWTARRGGYIAVSERKREWLDYRNARSEYDEWITIVRLQPADRPETTIDVDSLEGLVNVAIDTDNRVLEDPERDTFVVFEENRTYSYDPPAVPDDSGLLAREGDTGRTGPSPEQTADLEAETDAARANAATDSDRS